MSVSNGVATAPNGHTTERPGARFREEPEVLPVPAVPTLADWMRGRKDRRAGQPRPMYQRVGFGAAGALAGAAFVMVVGGVWVRSIVRDETDPKISQVYAYLESDYAAGIGEEVAKQIAKGPTVVVKSNPLEAAVPCVLTDTAKLMIGDDEKLSEALSVQARSLLANGVTPQQLRIAATGASVALTNDPATGAPLAAC